MIRPLILVDLDDCLFQTRAKCAQHAIESLVQASEATNGRHSFMTPVQNSFISWMLQAGAVVPVTARSTTAFDAVKIQFSGAAILSNGAVVRDTTGMPDRDWQKLMTERLRPHAAVLDSLLGQGQKIASAAGVSTRSWIVEEDGLKNYVVFKENGEGSGEGLGHIQMELESPAGWTVHCNGNNLSYSPPELSKRWAAQYVIEAIRKEHPATPVIGFGDSLTDGSFLSLCDWWGAPQTSQISDAVASISPSFAFPSRGRLAADHNADISE